MCLFNYIFIIYTLYSKLLYNLTIYKLNNNILIIRLCKRIYTMYFSIQKNVNNI